MTDWISWHEGIYKVRKSLHHKIILEWFENCQSLYPCPCQLKKLATSTSTSVLMKKPQVDGHHGESWRGNLSRARWLPILVTALVAPILARLLPPYAQILIFRVICLRTPTTRGACPHHEEHSLQLLLLVVGGQAPLVVGALNHLRAFSAQTRC